jgi:hypothetical protein
MDGPTLRQFYERVGTNAQDWAVEFVRLFKGFTIVENAGDNDGVVDAGTMIGWFANYASVVEVSRNGRLYDTVFDDAETLELWMHHLNEEGLDCSLLIMDHKKWLWTAFGEEHSGGGEWMTVHLMPLGDPVELDYSSEGEMRADRCEWCDMPEYKDMVRPLTEANYPVLVMTPRPSDIEIFWRFGDKLQRIREEKGELR